MVLWMINISALLKSSYEEPFKGLPTVQSLYIEPLRVDYTIGGLNGPVRWMYVPLVAGPMNHWFVAQW